MSEKDELPIWHEVVTNAESVYRPSPCSSSPPPSSSSPTSRKPKSSAADRAGRGRDRDGVRARRCETLGAPAHRRSQAPALFAPGRLVLGSEALYCDLHNAASGIELVDRAAPDPRLLAAARAALPEAAVEPIATAARVGDGHACADVEAMEGFAVLRAAPARRRPGARAARRVERLRRSARGLAHRRSARRRSHGRSRF